MKYTNEEYTQGEMLTTQSTEAFDEIGWLNSYFNGVEHRINEEDLKSVLYFALMWNMFESLACQKGASVPKITDKVNEIYCRNLLQLADFAPYLDYFQDRYLTGTRLNEKFDSLNFRRGDKKELVESVLKGDLDDTNNVVLALLLIVYRFRNNLFHGEKNVYKLSYQIPNFEVANQILATFLDLHKQLRK